jgi:hypothetical protein
MAKGKKTGGRVRGVPNKLSTGAKEVIAQVAENVGGVARMTKWVRESPKNEKAFWTSIYPKLLPLQVGGDKDNPLSVITRVERVIVDHTLHSDGSSAHHELDVSRKPDQPDLGREPREEAKEPSGLIPPSAKRHWAD